LVRKRVGVTPSGPVKTNRRVRARVPAAGKVLEEDDQPTLICIILRLFVMFFSYSVGFICVELSTYKCSVFCV